MSLRRACILTIITTNDLEDREGSLLMRNELEEEGKEEEKEKEKQAKKTWWIKKQKTKK